MTQSFQDLSKFMKQQVKLIEKPYEVDDAIIKLVRKHQKHNKTSERHIEEAFKKVQKRRRAYYHQYHSQQAIYQVSDQIEQLWSEKSEKTFKTLESLKLLDIPDGLQSDYKIHSIQNILDQLESLPNLPTEVGSNEPYSRFDKKKDTLIKKVQKLRTLKENIEKAKTYNKLTDLKIGDRYSIQKNIPTSNNNELHEEFTKLKIILEKFKNLSHEKKLKLKRLLENS